MYLNSSAPVLNPVFPGAILTSFRNVTRLFVFEKRSETRTMKRKVIAAMLTLLTASMVCPTAYAATEHYNDSSVTGDAAEWQAYKDNWETLSSDYTKVSLTPGKDG